MGASTVQSLGGASTVQWITFLIHRVATLSFLHNEFMG